MCWLCRHLCKHSSEGTDLPLSAPPITRTWHRRCSELLPATWFRGAAPAALLLHFTLTSALRDRGRGGPGEISFTGKQLGMFPFVCLQAGGDGQCSAFSTVWNSLYSIKQPQSKQKAPVRTDFIEMVPVMVQVLFQPQHRCNNALCVCLHPHVCTQNCETEQDWGGSKVLIDQKKDSSPWNVCYGHCLWMSTSPHVQTCEPPHSSLSNYLNRSKIH